MATARLSAVNNQIEKLTGIVGKNDASDARSDFKKLKEELHNLHTSCDDLISDSSGHQSELECAYQVLCDVLAKIGDLLSIIYDRTIESSLNEEVASLKKEVGSLQARIGNLQAKQEIYQATIMNLHEQLEKQQDDQDILMVGQLGVEIEKAIISKLLPSKAMRRYYRIFNMERLQEVLSDAKLRLKVFNNNESSSKKMLQEWSEMQENTFKKLNTDQWRITALINDYKYRRNSTAHPQFDLERTRKIVSTSYSEDEKTELEELITLFEDLKGLK